MGVGGRRLGGEEPDTRSPETALQTQTTLRIVLSLQIEADHPASCLMLLSKRDLLEMLSKLVAPVPRPAAYPPSPADQTQAQAHALWRRDKAAAMYPQDGNRPGCQSSPCYSILRKLSTFLAR